MKLDLERNAEWPLYLRLCEQLRRQVRAGVLKPGDRLPSFSQLREEYGVHKNTVERAHMILEREGLVVRRSGAGTFVASRGKRVTKGVVGLCGYGFQWGGTSSYWTRLLDGIRRGAEDADAQVLLLPDSVSDGWEKVDGALISGWSHDHFVDKLPVQIPLVCLFAGHEGRASVIADEYSGMREAIEHLLHLGHRRIAYLSAGIPANSPARQKGYLDALRLVGITPRKTWQRSLTGKSDYGPQFIEAGRRDMAAWLSDKSASGWNRIGCTALLCHNDETAFGVLQALNEWGLSVPTDVSLIGFDGVEIGEYAAPPLTTIEMPLRRIGEVGVEFLQRQIEQDEVMSEHKVLPAHLKVRESTAPPPR